MIGRERAAAQLANLIRAHPVVAVVGPLGIGKTELVRWVVQREAAAGRVPPPAREYRCPCEEAGRAANWICSCAPPQQSKTQLARAGRGPRDIPLVPSRSPIQ